MLISKRYILFFITVLCFMLLFYITSDLPIPTTGKSYSYAEPLHHVDTKKKLIALTFDDGPHPVYTRRLLKVLDKHKAKATFFVVGERAQWYAPVIRQIHRRGHEIGNHTFTHPHMKHITSEQLQEEIRKTDQIIHSLTGTYPRFFRPPGGEITYTVLRSSASQKHPIAIWSYHQDTRDWAHPGTAYIVSKVTSGARPGDIILFHDSGLDQSQTIEAVDKVLTILSKQGYRFVTLSQLLHEQKK
ncbi:chitooligosaccharide deacetylase [Aneurinibacillus migulanus]|uniref:Chitooligosaccharide deacetylase n=1 Tax=Aneurinibacillus migulanus TaxID=47500 RepID=A0A0D1XWL4_ANEMI|nr:polysaccharide deacetylase family protein [Aneurinibacillus migulanus]KIV55098.1 chitooligosaccharide deacetylase [Aneurinibacillus migulanus]KIV56518.1 chitooligosaccharide deacetylase [Aneurinibacillus migulanus]KON95274.1 chitooligosaccharide deacetylase [Aneurinibacillus migulanus]KPD06130.1 chitooligosaccharide deacetylase [Aneurinibacillus migulanus]MCP1356115.1 polysaccharide deacetylase family protein [Aneurinibacillus migulanus]